MTFEVGDKVIYPNHGLGIVERIEDKTILGTTCGFYHLRIVANETIVLVPVTNVDGVGLRRAISRRRGRAAVRPARRRQDRQPSELERTLQGQLGQDAQRLDLRSGRRAEEPDVPGEVQEPVVPREADARSREVPHHLGSVRSRCARRRRRSRRASTARSSAASRRRPARRRAPRSPRRRRVPAAPAPRAAPHARRRQKAGTQNVTRNLQGIRESPPGAKAPGGLFVYHPAGVHRRRPFGPHLRRRFPLRPHRRTARHAAGLALRVEGPPVRPRPHRRPARLALCGIRYRVGGAAAHPARSRRRLLREPPEQRRSAGAVRRAASADAHPLQGGDQRRFRSWRGRFAWAGSFRSIGATRKRRCGRSRPARRRFAPATRF